MKVLAAASIVLSLALGPGCAGRDRECRVGADCASGRCGVDGTCARGTPPDAALPPDAPAPRGDAGLDGPDAAPADAPPGSCAPEHDADLSRAELPARPGLSARYRVATEVPVDVAGAAQPDGTRRWDFTAALPGDRDLELVTLDPAGTWYAPAFPGASYAALLSARAVQLGVFELGPEELRLRGVVTPDPGAARTELVYDPPVAVLRFPVAEGGAWATDAAVRGVAAGVPLQYREEYSSAVDARGVAVTPLGEFPVLRVRVTLVRTVGFAVTVVRTVMFVAECYGTVAAVVSRDNEPASDFTVAAELRRLEP